MTIEENWKKSQVVPSRKPQKVNMNMKTQVYSLYILRTLSLSLLCNYHFFSWFFLAMWLLKSVNSNFTLAVRSPKLWQAKTHFLSHFGEKKRKNVTRSEFEPMISRSEVDHAYHYSIGSLLENWKIYLCNIHCDQTKNESWPVKLLVWVLPE